MLHTVVCSACSCTKAVAFLLVGLSLAGWPSSWCCVVMLQWEVLLGITAFAAIIYFSIRYRYLCWVNITDTVIH